MQANSKSLIFEVFESSFETCTGLLSVLVLQENLKKKLSITMKLFERENVVDEGHKIKIDLHLKLYIISVSNSLMPLCRHNFYDDRCKFFYNYRTV